MLIAMLLLPLSYASAFIADTPKTPQKKACGWELMQNLSASPHTTLLALNQPNPLQPPQYYYYYYYHY